MTETCKMSPVLKWAGGKTQILKEIIPLIPETYNNFYEPFVGGGAVCLAVSPKRLVINDINEQLINLYRQIKHSAEAVINLISEYDNRECDKELYLKNREKYNIKISNRELDAECAALMIWINKHCFNGLYRVNGKGLFNVPYNNRNLGKSINPENLLAIGSYFKNNNISISCKDFEEVCEDVKSGDFVYFDSPYIPESETAYFTDYTKDGFTYSDHKRLADLFARLDGIGARLMLSNNDVPLIYELYKGYNIRSFGAKRMINCNASKRFGKEVIITNY